MKHEPKPGLFAFPPRTYYDEIHEIPDVCKVHIPERQSHEMSQREMLDLAEKEEWYVIVHTVNWGSCDHWQSIPFISWIQKYYPQITAYKDKGRIVGYARTHTSVSLTKDKDYWKAEVWNS